MGRGTHFLRRLSSCRWDGNRVHEVVPVTHLEDGRSLWTLHCPGSFFCQDRLFYGRMLLWKGDLLPWGVTFTDPQSLARLRVPLHPTQLYEAAGGLFLFFFLTWMEKRKSYDGQIFWLFLLLYSLLRFLIEFFRDDPRGFLPGTFLSTSQAIGILLAILSLYMLNYLKRRFRR